MTSAGPGHHWRLTTHIESIREAHVDTYTAGNHAPGVLPRITLGLTGLEASRLGLGGFHQVEISSEVVAAVVAAYVEAGGNYIETARSYGNGASEAKIGRALRGAAATVHVSSKSTVRTEDEMRREIDASLAALGRDRLAFYFLHGVNSPEELDKITGPHGALRALTKAQDEGLIAGIGFSSHRIEMYIEAIKRLPLEVILIWTDFLEDMYLPEIAATVLPLARKHGVGITGMKPLADGFLYRSAQPALRYALGMGAEVVICGANSVRHVNDAVKAICAGGLNKEQRDELLRDAPELGCYVCRQCGKCPAELMQIFRWEGYIDRQMIDYLEHDPADYALRMRLGGWFALADRARELYQRQRVDEQRLLAEAAAVDCPYHIDVARKARIALAKLRGDNPAFL